MKLKLPRIKKARGSRSGRTRARGGIIANLGGRLGGLFSGGSTSNSTGQTVSGNTRNNKSGGANYGPLPSLNARASKAKKIKSPTLADVSVQLGNILSKVAFIDQVLKDQLELDKFQYKETARLQKEAQAERRIDASVPLTAAAGMNFTALEEAFSKLLKSIDDASTSLNEGSGSGLPLAGGIPEKGARGGKEKFKASKFVKKTEALNKKGKLRSGYEEVTGKNGGVVGYRKTFKPGITGATAKESRLGIRSIGKSALGGLGRVVGAISNKVLTPAIIAYQSYEAWQEIQALPKDISPAEKKNKIAKIVSRLVGQVGLMWAGAALGTMAGTSIVPGPGSLVGLIGGIAGGLTADYFFADDVDSIVNMVVDRVMPVQKEKPVSKPKQTTKPRADLTPIQSEPQTTVPVSKPRVIKRKTSGTSASAAIDRYASKVGVDPYVVKAISKETNPNLNMSLDVETLKGSEIFKLTPSQWSQVMTKYGSTFSELSNGMDDPKAAITAASLLARDAQTFLIKNDIPTTPDKLFAAFLVGPEGIESLSRSRPETPAKEVVPSAASRKPELFNTPNGKPISSSGFLERTFNVSPNQTVQINQSNVPNIKNSRQTQQNASQPESAQSQSRPAPTTQNEKPAVEKPTPEAKPIKPVEKPANTPSSEDLNKDEASKNRTIEVNDVAPLVAAPIAAPVESGKIIDEASSQVESMETSDELVVLNTQSDPNVPAILPSTTAGYTGTGNVPDPTFDLGEINQQLFFRAMA